MKTIVTLILAAGATAFFSSCTMMDGMRNSMSNSHPRSSMHGNPAFMRGHPSHR